VSLAVARRLARIRLARAADKETPPCSVYGIDNLRIADGSILPRVTTDNTMAPCVIVGENAAAFIKSEASLKAQLEQDRRQPAHHYTA